MTGNFQEKRREPRLPAEGLVKFRSTDPPHGSFVEGLLVDISPSGFRAQHAFSGLASGQIVFFEHAQAQGRARVAWNRISSGAVESGFFVLPG
jgi:hypothetical protein